LAELTSKRKEFFSPSWWTM